MDIESNDIEWKEIWKSEYLRTIAAFYNTNGGRMIVGRNDHGVYVGVIDLKGVMKSISDTIRNKLRIICDVHEETFEGKDCIVIDVPVGVKTVSYNGEFPVRIGNATHALEAEELKERLLGEKGLQWLDQPSGITVADLSQDAISYFVRKGKESKRIPESVDERDVVSILERYNLIRSGEPTLAGALLFSDQPDKLNNGAYLRIGKFDSKGFLIRDDFIKGPLIKLPELAIDRLFDVYVQPTYMYDKGISTYNRYDYPIEAVRELILNAIIHMDYKVASPITVKVFPDSLEVFCTGELSSKISIESMMVGGRSIRRNESLAFTFYASGSVEAWGQGIPKVIQACKDNDNPAPKFALDTGGLSVTIGIAVRNDPEHAISDGYMDVPEKIVSLMRANPKIRIKDLVAEIGLSDKSIRVAIDKLREQGRLIRVGSNRYGHWKIVE